MYIHIFTEYNLCIKWICQVYSLATLQKSPEFIDLNKSTKTNG